MKENGTRELNINDRSPAESVDYLPGPKDGLKRRASSPPPETARHDSYTTAASSMGSNGGDQRLSHNALSPLGEPDSILASPYAANRTLDPSPRGSLSRPPPQRGFSEAENPQVRKMSENMSQSRHNSISGRIPGPYICECCPKNPKKFDSEENLKSVIPELSPTAVKIIYF
jgi:hypothetical protein